MKILGLELFTSSLAQRDHRNLMIMIDLFKIFNENISHLADPKIYKKFHKNDEIENKIRQIDTTKDDKPNSEKPSKNKKKAQPNYLEQALDEEDSSVKKIVESEKSDDAKKIKSDDKKIKKENSKEQSAKSSTISDAEPVKISNEQLKELNISYNPETKRYQETDGKRQFVSYENVLKRLEALEKDKKAKPNKVEKVKFTDKQLEKVGVRYNPETKRYQEIAGKKQFVSYENVAKKIESNSKQNDSEKVKITDKQLEKAGLRYNAEAQRYQEVEGKKHFVSYENVLKKIEPEEQEPAKQSEKDEKKPSLLSRMATSIKNFFKKPEKKPESENKSGTLLESINSNLIKANASLDNIIKFLTGEKPPEGEKPDDGDATPEDDGKTEKPKGGAGGLVSGLGGVLFSLFAFYPVLLLAARQFGEKYKEKISQFLEPIFKFVLTDVPHFFTDTIPKFFTKTLPDFFKDKFDAVKSHLEDFMDNITIFMANIKKGVGTAIVTVGNALPGGIGKDIAAFGQEMVDNADKDIKAAEDRKSNREDDRAKKENIKLLMKQADEAGQKFLETHKGEYTHYEVKYDEKAKMVIISYSGGTANDLDKAYDAEESLASHTLVPWKTVKADESKDAKPAPDTGEVTPKDAKPAETETKSTPSASGGTSVGAAGSGSTGGSIGGESGAASAGGTSSSSSGQSGGTPAAATPATMTPESGGTPEQTNGGTPEPASAGNKPTGEQIVAGSMETTAPQPTSKAGTNVIPINSGGKAGATKVQPGVPFNINDVPDPTPPLGALSSQLFYMRA